jgi:hypothetical protein
MATWFFSQKRKVKMAMIEKEIIKKLVELPELEHLRDLAAKAVHKVFAVNADDLVWGDGIPEIQYECDEFRRLLAELDLCDVPKDNEILYKEIMRPLYFLEISKAK